MANALYYGDNLYVLRDEIASESVDLIYLDPPFNSQANYNVLFKSPAGKAADAQIEAFEDTWHWGEQAERAFSDVLASPATQAAELLRAMRVLGRKRHDGLPGNDGSAADRIAPNLEADRLALFALRPDRQPLFEDIDGHDFWPDANRERDYLATYDPKGLAFTRFASNHDAILYYRSSENYTWNPQYAQYSSEYVERYNLTDPGSGRRFQAT